EIASESRSMHKSQGFGSSKRRGGQIEYLELIKGEASDGTIFQGIDRKWNRVAGGAKIGKAVDKILADFNPSDPAASVPALQKVHKLIQDLPDGYWKDVKLRECEALILACAGIWLEATADAYSAAYGETISVTASAVRRSPVTAKISKINFNGRDTLPAVELPFNEMTTFATQIKVPTTARTHPYWLEQPFVGMYGVDNQEMIGRPLNPPTMQVTFSVEVGDVAIDAVRPLMYKWTDRVKGELYRPFSAMPAVTANIADKVYIFSGDAAQAVDVSLRFHQDVTDGSVTLDLPAGWKVDPEVANIASGEAGTEQSVQFSVTPPAGGSAGTLGVNLLFGARDVGRSLVEISYDHIETQTLVPLAQARVVKLDVATRGQRIAYLPGAGDEVPQSLEQLGYEVTLLDEKALRAQNLGQYDAIVAGIRAFNTQPYLKYVNEKLLQYVKDGGTYVVQYNTNRGLVTQDIGPYPFKLSRDRVTVEEATPTFLAPEHPLMNVPNKIGMADFDGWVQERGLYFPNEWDDRYTALIGWNDPGEEMKQGCLLVTDYGKGAFIYTGISFFRELPAGVPGAYKLFANIISYGKDNP
ncbi:MAG: NEW3 domain-containing protein, partial [Bacteroidota bacterium]